jgi:hypothetical protein
MLKGGLTVKQAQAITGHKSERMTEWYCHFDPAEFGKAKEVQAALLTPEGAKKEEKPKAASGAGRRGSVIAFPAKEDQKKRKQA